jgi:hypothetical protein
MEFCPNCGIGLSNGEKRIKFCQNCRTDFKQDESDGWVPAKVECNLCGHHWIAVYHSTSEELECPKCNNMTLFNVIEFAKK